MKFLSKLLILCLTLMLFPAPGEAGTQCQYCDWEQKCRVFYPQSNSGMTGYCGCRSRETSLFRICWTLGGICNQYYECGMPRPFAPDESGGPAVVDGTTIEWLEAREPLLAWVLGSLAADDGDTATAGGAMYLPLGEAGGSMVATGTGETFESAAKIDRGEDGAVHLLVKLREKSTGRRHSYAGALDGYGHLKELTVESTVDYSAALGGGDG